jgi:uncharacterized cupredoxin-like copper-binding protein
MFRKFGATLLAMTAFGVGAATLVAGPVAAKSSGNTLEVQAGEYAYTVKGAPHAGWVTISFDNLGQENHMLAIVQVKPSVTAKQVKAAALSNDQAAFDKLAQGDSNRSFGTPDLLGPGQSTETVSQLPAGRYALLCFVPAPDGSPHVAHGMVTTIDVKKPSSSAKPPKAQVNVTLSDTEITVPSGDAPKQFTAKVTNTGTTPHSFTLVNIEPGQTIDTVKTYFDAFFNTGQASGPPPGAIVGGVSGLDPGKVAYLVQTLQPGHYAYISTGGEAPDDDYAKGLHGEFDVQ